jgi:stalled ribosome rescue protein Dom34
MKAIVIWIDRERANLYLLSAEDFERKSVTAKHASHHTHREENLDHQKQECQLFLKVVDQLKDMDKLLILGPGVAKYHLQVYLMEHFPALARKIVGCETTDHPSDAQIAAYARKYFELEEPSVAKKRA